MNADERPWYAWLIDVLGWLLAGLLALLALLPPVARWLDDGDRDYSPRSRRRE
jgi:hypothetical protein